MAKETRDHKEAMAKRAELQKQLAKVEASIPASVRMAEAISHWERLAKACADARSAKDGTAASKGDESEGFFSKMLFDFEANIRDPFLDIKRGIRYGITKDVQTGVDRLSEGLAEMQAFLRGLDE
jgi:hypothetical protein